ncbi:MAG: hypothetical protein ACRC6U_04180 [Fusobacteriaceae bacterium]
MYILENILGESNIKIKKSNYISIVTNKTELSRKILQCFYNYFSEKKVSIEEKVLIMNYFTGEKEHISAKYPIYIENSEIDFEVELGSKSILHQRILNYFKQKFPIEPVFTTLNTLLENFFLEEVSENFKNEFSIYSNYKIDFQCSLFNPSDLVKKINIKYLLDEKEQNLTEISNFEKIKLKLSMYELRDTIKNREKIYIFYYPERLLTTIEIKKLKLFLKELTTKSSTVILATNSKHLLGDNLQEINIISSGKLLNFENTDSLKNKYLENYPKLEEWNFIEKRLIYLLKNNIFENIEEIKVTNKLKNSIDEIFLESYEDIFISIFYLKEIGVNYNLDIIYDDNCVFSNYIKKNF